MSQSVKQTLEQGSAKVGEEINEFRECISDSSFAIRETCGADDRSYEMRHYRGSMIRWQEDGSVILIARSSNATPNEGYLDVKSTGYMHFVSGHNIKLIAEGHRVTGGGEAGEDEEKSVEIFGTGDIVMQSNGKGGVVINAAKDIELIAGGSIKLKAAEQVSIQTGSLAPGLGIFGKDLGSGKLTIATGIYELGCTSYKETVTGSKSEENFGEVIRDQKLSLTQPAALGPGAHITTDETVGSYRQVIGHDYDLEVGGKMRVRVHNSPLAKVGPLQPIMPTEAVKWQIIGSRKTELLPGITPPYAQDHLSVPVGNVFTEIGASAPGTSAWSVDSKIKGDITMTTKAIGTIGLVTGPVPSNAILLQNTGGSIRIQANGALGMIQMLATKMISGTALKINLN
jgi:hypothetical protein